MTDKNFLFSWLNNDNEPNSSTRLTDALDALYKSDLEEDKIAHSRANLLVTLDRFRKNPVFYERIDNTPVGSLFICMHQKGLLAVNFAIPEVEFLRFIRGKTGVFPVQSNEDTKKAREQISAYLTGSRHWIDLPLDISHLTSFQRNVLQAARQIPRGQVRTYGEIAKKLGKPNAARAVGQALGRNPIPIVIPCHRVIASNGDLGGYSGGGGLETKRWLLQLEGALLT